MLRQIVLAVGLQAAALTSSAAQLLIDVSPTEGLPGCLTYRLSIQADGAESFRGLDADFRGPMNQVNPVGNATIFHREYWPFFTFENPLVQDSHFWFESTQVLAIGATESNANLTAAFSGLAALSLPNPTLFAKIVTDEPTAVNYQLAFDLGGPDPVVFAGFLSVPEPGGLVIAAGFAVALVGRFR